MRILIAEDEPIDAELLSIILGVAGHEPLVVTNGQEALDQVRNGGIELVFMDLVMPVLDGLTAIRLLREDPATAELPIVGVTALARSREELMNTGVSAVILKPYTRRILLETLESVLPKTSAPSHESQAR